MHKVDRSWNICTKSPIKRCYLLPGTNYSSPIHMRLSVDCRRIGLSPWHSSVQSQLLRRASERVSLLRKQGMLAVTTSLSKSESNWATSRKRGTFRSAEKHVGNIV